MCNLRAAVVISVPRGEADLCRQQRAFGRRVRAERREAHLALGKSEEQDGGSATSKRVSKQWKWSLGGLYAALFRGLRDVALTGWCNLGGLAGMCTARVRTLCSCLCLWDPRVPSLSPTPSCTIAAPASLSTGATNGGRAGSVTDPKVRSSRSWVFRGLLLLALTYCTA